MSGSDSTRWKTSTADRISVISRIAARRSTMPHSLVVFQGDDQFALRACSMDLDAVEGSYGSPHMRERGRPGMNKQGRDVELRRHGRPPSHMPARLNGDRTRPQ